jgi:Putative addiction module component
VGKVARWGGTLPQPFHQRTFTHYTSLVTTTAEEVLKEALQLPEGERARVAAEILASLEPDVETRDSDAWIAEVERRAHAAIAGLPGLEWSEVRAHVEERISHSRK